MKDIGKIQKRLAEIKTILEKLDAGDLVRMRPKIAKVESEGTDLLGKLSIAYNFDTGISSCPIELLRSACESGRNDN